MRATRPPSIHTGLAPQETDEIPEIFREVVINLLAERESDAEQALARLPPTSRVSATGRALTAREQLRVFRRDSFTCRYCARRTLFVPVLRVLSSIYPEKLRYHPHWRWDVTHPAYWTHGCSCDHLIPVCRGGNSTFENLVTACYQCNSIKQQWLLEELRWNLLPPVTDQEWDGLSGSYLALCRTTGAGQDRYHAAWMRAVSERRR